MHQDAHRDEGSMNEREKGENMVAHYGIWKSDSFRRGHGGIKG